MRRPMFLPGRVEVEETERRLANRRSGSEVDRDLDLPRRTVPIEQIDEAVARITASQRATWNVAGLAAARPSSSRWSWPAV